MRQIIRDMNARLSALETRINFLFGALGVIVVMANAGIAIAIVLLKA